MNLKNSNKYLFDQTVSCYNCKYCISRYHNMSSMNLCTKLTDMNSTYSYSASIFYVRRMICGPIGKYYEPKDK